MNFEPDDLLDMVDEWKFKLHDKLKNMTPQERAVFWAGAREEARAMGLQIVGEDQPKRPKRKRARRVAKKTG